MTDGENREMHRIHERIDSLVSFMKWTVGLFVPLVLAVMVAGVNMEGRVSSLEASRDTTKEALSRIDRNLEALAEYIRGSSR